MRAIPDPGFAGDDGSVSPAVAAALDEVAGGAPLEVAVAALCDARLLVPVVAVPGEAGRDVQGHDGQGRDVQGRDVQGHDGQGRTLEKTSDMAAVLMTGHDGRRGLLAFTATATLRAWDPDARPVPVSASQAAQAALAEGAEALVVDVAGPVQVPLEGDALHRVAEGRRLLRTEAGWAWVAPAAGPDRLSPAPDR